ncbi:hypothetical protein NBRC116188_00110 [Oceaniserpentilla sp. 4NH20-0058]|uniref:hypothetical protein n=1 Tax=Oceaniserpentilla sp. 4NH20-0058 TaxID=3127660 RepID=UPI0031069BCA
MNKLLIGICSISLLTACSSSAIKDTSLIEQAAINLVESGEQNVQGILDESRALQIQAQQADLYLYSPKHMKQAEDEMAKAESAFKQQEPDQEIIAHCLTAKVLFERGLALKPVVEQQLSASFEALDMLKAINAHALLADDFKDLENDRNELISLIEDGKTNDATQDQIGFLKDATELEIATLKISFLIPAEQALEKAEDVDADDYAAKTFETAEKEVEKLELLIETQYKDREAVGLASKSAVRNAQHATNIAKAAKPLIKLNPKTAEQHILFIESLLDRITSALNQDSVVHLPLRNQSIALAQKVETLNKQAQTNLNNPNWATEKSKLEQTIASLKAQLTTKTAELELTQAVPAETEATTVSTNPSEIAAEAAQTELTDTLSDAELNTEKSQSALDSIDTTAQDTQLEVSPAQVLAEQALKDETQATTEAAIDKIKPEAEIEVAAPTTTQEASTTEVEAVETQVQAPELQATQETEVAEPNKVEQTEKNIESQEIEKPQVEEIPVTDEPDIAPATPASSITEP